MKTWLSFLTLMCCMNVGAAEVGAIASDVGGGAANELAECGSQADRQLKAVLQSVAFPPEYIQAALVSRIDRTDFKNTTPGTYDQEYVGTYRLTYRAAEYANFAEQVISVRFTSPFICDSLKLWCLSVESSFAADGVDLAGFPKTGPLACPK